MRPKFFEYTAYGDTINTAARLEAATSTLERAFALVARSRQECRTFGGD